MTLRLDDDDVIARLRAGAPGYPTTGPDAGRALAGARRALRRSRVRRTVGAVASVLAVAAVGLTAIGPAGTPFGYDLNALPHQGDPPVYPHDRMVHDVASLEAEVLPMTVDLGLTSYIDERATWVRPACRVFTWSQGAFRDRDSRCANPDDPELPFDAASTTAFNQLSDAIAHSGVNVYRIEKGGWSPGTSFHLRDDSWQWNWCYSYIPNTPANAQAEIRSETNIGPRLQVHVSGNWWFTVEPDD